MLAGAIIKNRAVAFVMELIEVASLIALIALPCIKNV